MNHMRPFLLRHQAKLDYIAGFLYSEMVRFSVSVHTPLMLTETKKNYKVWLIMFCAAILMVLTQQDDGICIGSFIVLFHLV